MEARKTHVLDEKQRNDRNAKIITLAEKHGLSTPLIAERFGIRRGAVAKIIREHKEALQS